MKLEKSLFIVMLFLCGFTLKSAEVIRINQLGYLPKSVKVAVFISSENRDFSLFLFTILFRMK
jgi:endoglucanase